MTVIWHNPRCSKSRQTLGLLTDRGITPEIRLYLKDPPNAEDIVMALKILGISNPIDMMRQSEKIFKELNLSANSSPDTLIHAMADNPILIERPIVFTNDQGRIGRPPENVLDIL